MNVDIGRSLKRSSEDFLNLVWPQVGGQFGRIIPVESVSATEFATELDARAGIDVWVIQDGLGSIRGLASRVQWPRHSGFNTFTIRIRSRYGRETEYHKRRRELETDGAIRPHYICQAYIRCVNPWATAGHRDCKPGDHIELMSAAIARMRDVIAVVEQDAGQPLPPNADGTQGYAVPWSCLRDIAIWPDPVGAQVA